MADEEGRRLRLGIGAIFKNECPYILEWVAYHRAMGVERFFIADNNSDDGSTELLAALDAAGVVDHIPFPHVPDQPPQLAAYRETLRRHSRDADWIAFIDADEFLFPTDQARSLLPFLAEIDADPGIGAVVLNWAGFGSSGHLEATDDLVIQRFTRRAEMGWLANHHYKTCVRVKAGPVVRATPHLLGVANGYRTVQSNCNDLESHPARGEGLSAGVVWDRVRVNHYIVKSRAEFFGRKGPKGRATVVGKTKGENYYLIHDRNDHSDPMPAWLIDATMAEMAHLRAVLEGRAALVQAGERMPRAMGEASPPPATVSAPQPSQDATGGPTVPDAPAMPAAVARHLLARMRKSRCYLEYGSGGSTVQAARSGVPAILAVESDRRWLDAVSLRLAGIPGVKARHLLYVDIGPTKELGYPVAADGWRNYSSYALDVWRLCRSNRLSPDLVLVDGRFRVACFLASLLFAPRGCRILFDDYLDRPFYHNVEHFVRRAGSIDRMGEFVVPRRLPRDEVWLALMRAVADPR